MFNTVLRNQSWGLDSSVIIVWKQINPFEILSIWLIHAKLLHRDVIA